MCAATASEHQAEAPSKLNLLLQRIEQETAEGKVASVNGEEAALLAELADRYYRLKRRHDGQVLIERAKEIVSDQLGCRLSEAFHWIQKKATSKNKTLEETVELILMADEMRREREAEEQGRPLKRREG